jgi:hypothetical protein
MMMYLHYDTVNYYSVVCIFIYFLVLHVEVVGVIRPGRPRRQSEIALRRQLAIAI